jgi:hypothetical protein
MPTYRIIVSRYNENIEWTKQFQNVIIANKGEPLKNVYNQTVLTNVGREGHTYYKYIYDNYENLPDYMIFLQGNPFDHSPNIIQNLKKTIQTITSRPNTKCFHFLSEHMHYSTLNAQRGIYPECKNIHKDWERVFGEIVQNKDTDTECIFGAGAQFVVSKQNVLQNPIEFYKNIVQMLEYDICPLEGYNIERFHKYIFNR